MALRAFEGLWRRANSRPADGNNPGRAVALDAPNFLFPVEECVFARLAGCRPVIILRYNRFAVFSG
jgi:hypothetical protein